MLYQFKTTATMKEYNRRKWWIDSGIVREITIEADTITAAVKEYQKEGVAVGLIDFSTKLRTKEFPQGVSSFILEENISSTSLCKKISTGINKEFRLYEIEE